MLHQVGGEDVDVELIGLDLGVLLPYLGESLVPEGHGVDVAVRLRRRAEVSLALPGQLDRVAYRAIVALPGEDGLLDGGLALAPPEEAAAHFRIFALGVLAHDDEVDLPRRAAGQRRRHAGQEPDGPQVDVLIELPADGDEQSPERDVIGHARPAHRAELDGVVLADLLEAVLRHHPAGLEVPRAAPVERLPLEGDAESSSRRLQHAHTFGHHFRADAVSGNDRDPVSAHESLPRALYVAGMIAAFTTLL